MERAADLPDALEQALASQQRAVVDVVTSTAVTFCDVTSPLAAYPPVQAPAGRR